MVFVPTVPGARTLTLIAQVLAVVPPAKLPPVKEILFEPAIALTLPPQSLTTFGLLPIDMLLGKKVSVRLMPVSAGALAARLILIVNRDVP